MKNIVYILTLISLTSFAQIEKGKKYLGGTFSSFYTTNSINYRSNAQFSISPSFLYFVGQSFAIGVSAKYTLLDNLNNNRNNLSAGPTARYVFPIRENIYMFVETNLSFGIQRYYTGLSITAYINPGVTFFLSKKVALEAAFAGLNMFFNKNSPSSVNLSFNPLSKVGVSFYF